MQYSQHPQAHDAYYGQGPLVQLNRTVCIIGHRGAPVDKVTRYLGATFGLRYALLDELMAHDLGGSPFIFANREGIGPYRHLEAKKLRHAVKEKPNGLLGFHSDAMSGQWTRLWVRRHARTVWLETGFSALLKGARQDQNLYPGFSRMVTEQELLRHMNTAWRGQKADLVMDLFDGPPSVIAMQLAKALGWRSP